MVAKKAVILVTGGAGSLGREIVRELILATGYTIRVLDNSEYALYELQRFLENKEWDASGVRYFQGDIRDKDRLRRAMVGVSSVIHTAALKHVPNCEFNPVEAVRTNIDGSINVIEVALDSGVDKVLAISSDKAVHPINIYGATKLAMEKLVTHSNVYGDTKFSCVRFGNFLESRGNVVRRWYKEAQEGKPLTITEKEMTRFWIHPGEAAQFTLKCLDIMEGGEIFIPKMDEASIMEMAQRVSPDCEVKVIGKRPGEKLHELLSAEGEVLLDKDNYFVVECK